MGWVEGHLGERSKHLSKHIDILAQETFYNYLGLKMKRYWRGYLSLGIILASIHGLDFLRGGTVAEPEKKSVVLLPHHQNCKKEPNLFNNRILDLLRFRH